MPTETDDEILPDEEVDALAVDEVDDTEAILRSWGLSGEPVTWAQVSWQPVIATIRACNTGFSSLAAVQALLDATFPDKDYEAANVALAHAPTAEFHASGQDPEVNCELTTDADLDLPNDVVTFDYGDGTVLHGDPVTHTYTEVGDYTITCTVHVAGVAYSTSQPHEIPDIPPPPPADPEPQDLPGHPAAFTIAQIEDWVDQHAHLAADVLTHERARGSSARVTLVDWLEGFIESHDGPDQP